jgi:hypothetical protein
MAETRPGHAKHLMLLELAAVVREGITASVEAS